MRALSSHTRYTVTLIQAHLRLWLYEVLYILCNIIFSWSKRCLVIMPAMVYYQYMLLFLILTVLNWSVSMKAKSTYSTNSNDTNHIQLNHLHSRLWVNYDNGLDMCCCFPGFHRASWCCWTTRAGRRESECFLVFLGIWGCIFKIFGMCFWTHNFNFYWRSLSSFPFLFPGRSSDLITGTPLAWVLLMPLIT